MRKRLPVCPDRVEDFLMRVFSSLLALACLLALGHAAPVRVGPNPDRKIDEAKVTYFVSLTGKDTNDGRSRATAFATMQHAADVVQPGETVLVTKGVYHQGLHIKKVGILGCGLMGSGIAQVSAMAGFDVTVLEAEQKFLDKGFAAIEKSLAKFAEKGTIKEPAEAVRARLKGTLKPEDLADCDIIVEAIIENIEAKKAMFSKLDAVVKKDAIFATNTSSISVTEVMATTKRPDRFVGLHFFNPVPLMKLVEVVRTIATDEQVFETAFEFGKKLGKVPVRTSDKTGFIVNRLLVPYLLDAIRAYEEGVGSIADIDSAMKLGCGYPMGPFTLLDFVGLDTTYYITHVMFDEFKERRFASPPLLKRMVMAGWFGKKSGKGFYDWSNPEKPVAQDAALRAGSELTKGTGA
jgi:3-hydroxybutyryl-CoA dehydrogenase